MLKRRSLTDEWKAGCLERGTSGLEGGVRRRAEEQRALPLPYTLWNRQAELANEYLAKGRQIYIEGRLRQEEYTDREGNKRVSLEVTATEMQFLGRRDDSALPASADAGLAQTEEALEAAKPAANGSGRSGKKGSKRAAKETVSVEEAVGIEEDGIPF